MGLFDIFGGGQTDVSGTQQQLWSGNQMYNNAGNQAIQMLQQALGAATGGLQPYAKTGTSGMEAYAGLLGIPGVSTTYNPMSYLQSTPGYQWGQQQGLGALNASLAPQGLIGSGPQREASIKFGQNYGTNQYQTLMQQLAGLGQMGQQANTQIGNWDIGTAGQEAGIELGMGQNAQNTNATIAGLGLQNQQQNQQSSNIGLGNMLGLGLGALMAPMTGGTSLLGAGANYLGNMLGPLFSGAGGGGGSSLSGVSNALGGSGWSGFGM